MEENIFNALPGFDRMLEQKTFEALSVREKDLVLRFITKEEYNLFREAVQVSRHGKLSGEPLLTPDPSVKSRLMQTFGPAERPQSVPVSGTISRCLSYRIPLYQAALAASVLLFLVFYLLLQNDRMPVQVAIADTVYIDKPVLQKDTIWLEKPEVNKPNKQQGGKRHPKAGNIPSAQSLPENPLYISQMHDAMSRMSLISGLGKDKSVHHDAGLMKLVAVEMRTTSSP
jgi:hypothetical protein